MDSKEKHPHVIPRKQTHSDLFSFSPTMLGSLWGSMILVIKFDPRNPGAIQTSAILGWFPQSFWQTNTWIFQKLPDNWNNKPIAMMTWWHHNSIHSPFNLTQSHLHKAILYICSHLTHEGTTQIIEDMIFWGKTPEKLQEIGVFCRCFSFFKGGCTWIRVSFGGFGFALVSE